jgi:hypothetical protein
MMCGSGGSVKMVNYFKDFGLSSAWLCILLCTNCCSRSGSELFHQKIPIEIQGGNAVDLNMRGLVGEHMVGITCSPDVWTALTNYQKGITVRLKSSDKKTAEVFAFEPGLKRTSCDEIIGAHYLFAVSAIGDAVVEISFPKMPVNASADIIICKTPEETESPY